MTRSNEPARIARSDFDFHSRVDALAELIGPCLSAAGFGRISKQYEWTDCGVKGAGQYWHIDISIEGPTRMVEVSLSVLPRRGGVDAYVGHGTLLEFAGVERKEDDWHYEEASDVDRVARSICELIKPLQERLRIGDPGLATQLLAIDKRRNREYTERYL